MYNKILEEICIELGIKYRSVSKGWIHILEKGNNIKYIAGYKFPLNDHSCGEVIDDKYATYEALVNKNIPVINHRILYDKDNTLEYAMDSNDRKIAYEYLDKYKKIVIKTNIGTCGLGVFLVTSVEEIDNILDKLFTYNESVSICPYYDIKCEYRVIILNGEIRIVYGKVRPKVVGDGIRKISELLHEFNPSFNYIVEDDYILGKGVEYIYSWKHNLSNGSIIDMDVKNKKDIIKLAKDTAKVLNLRFGSVDIIDTDNKLMIMECNSGVMMDNLINILPNGYDIAKNIYKDAVKSMFDEE